MADVRPFQAFRPAPDRAARVACPPYDIISSAEARQLAAGNSDSFLRVVKPEVDLPPGTDAFSDAVYARGAANLADFIGRGLLVRDGRPAYYPYRLEWRGRRQTGLLCLASVEEYDRGAIRRHELTRRDREVDRTRHGDAQDGTAEPVFLAYHDRGGIDELIRSFCAGHAPVYDLARDENVHHTVWVMDDPQYVDRLRGLFASIDALYIADGHHRAFAASQVRKLRRERHGTAPGPWDRFMTVVFPDHELNILEYNRVVTTLGSLLPEAFLKRVAERFDITPGSGRPSCPHEFGMLLGSTWHRLVPKPGTYNDADPIEALDVSIIHTNLIGPVLGIADLKTDVRIAFVGGTRGTAELERQVKAGAAVAFALFPASITQLMAVADAGLIMPPKSTWFFPKPASGLVVYTYS